MFSISLNVPHRFYVEGLGLTLDSHRTNAHVDQVSREDQSLYISRFQYNDKFPAPGTTHEDEAEQVENASIVESAKRKPSHSSKVMIRVDHYPTRRPTSRQHRWNVA